MRIAAEANAAAYRSMVYSSAPGDCWDFLIITAANEQQAELYRQEMRFRGTPAGPAGAFFPPIQKNVAMADPPGRRPGSGGATIAALLRLMRQFRLTAADLARLRILMVHSGGPAMRLPAYSALGKIFAPLPLLRPDGQICTLFDHLYVTLAGLPQRLGPGVLIAAGDVLLAFDHRLVPAGPHRGAAAIAMRVGASAGTAHGVFVVAADGRVRRVLQKATVEQMRAAGAVGADGRVCIDTGLLFLDPATAMKLVAAGRRLWRRRGDGHGGEAIRFSEAVDLYDDIAGAMACDADDPALDGQGAKGRVRAMLRRGLCGIDFRALTVDGGFLHLGTTRQFRDAIAGRDGSPAASLFRENVLTQGRWRIGLDRRVYNSALLGEGGSLGTGSVVECSVLGPGCRIGAGSVVSQVVAVRHPPDMGEGMLFFQAPLRYRRSRRRFAQVLCGVNDDFGGRYEDGSCTFLNEPIGTFLRRHRISPRDIWRDADDRTLWTARLFPLTDQRDAFDAVGWMATATASSAAVRRWRCMERVSMAMVLDRADPGGIIEHREAVAAVIHAGALVASIERDQDRPMESFVGHYLTPAGHEAAVGRLMDYAAGPAPSWRHKLRQSRALWCAAQMAQRMEAVGGAGRDLAEQCMSAAFGRIAQASEAGVPAHPGARAGSAHLRAGRYVEAVCPVRLDLAGGWTDTPPYCYERGGHVVNVAIDLDDAPPVRATVRMLDEPVVVLEALDLGQKAVLHRLESVPPDVRDPLALHKEAMRMVGLLPEGGGELSGHLRKLGAGLAVSTECRVPKGSGLGTSSILAATLLAALRAAAGRPATRRQLIRQTLLLEQRLTTGGGWQDQAGGIVGGIKSIVTAPGVPQRPAVEELSSDSALAEELEKRLVVYYSGQQRLARDILRRVVGRWLAREPAAVELLEDLRRQAALLRAALLTRDWHQAGAAISRYWEIKKQLYPGSTTPAVDVMFSELRGRYLAAGLAGAGGGGFAYFLCADERAALSLRRQLADTASRPGALGAVYRTRINRAGLTVCLCGGGRCDAGRLRI